VSVIRTRTSRTSPWLKPGLFATNRYIPAGRSVARTFPSSAVMTVLSVTPVSWLIMSTEAPGSTAPLVSTTVIAIPPRLPWADAVTAENTNIEIRSTSTRESNTLVFLDVRIANSYQVFKEIYADSSAMFDEDRLDSQMTFVH